MARMPRVVVLDAPHHITQRGNARRRIFLVATPHRSDAFARALRHRHGRYAEYLNARQAASGHVWQGRCFSCPLGPWHLWAAMRYVELNPVRAGMVACPEAYPWSSALAHSSGTDRHGLLEMSTWQQWWAAQSWREFLAAGCEETDLTALRGSTHTGRPLRSEEFVKELERLLGRSLVPRPGGRPPKPSRARSQMSL